MGTAINRLPPGARHALLALAIQLVATAALAGLYFMLPVVVFLFVAGGANALWFYAGRERRQAEEQAGSNAIPITQILPRSWRDIGWPALAVTLVAALVGLAQ